MKIEIYDSTLRDGAQGRGISFSLQDKLKITERLDAFGVSYIEAGNPQSNPKDAEFFAATAKRAPNHARLVAFGSTRRKDIPASDDEGLNALIEAGTKYVCIFGKCSARHVDVILGTTREENLHMIADSISYLVSRGKTVFFDAEHFFDGYKNDPDYAIAAVKTAQKAGADVIVLCDTNGGTFPDEIGKIVKATAKELHVKLGIHCHNDNGCAVAGTIAAVRAGCVQVQGTFVGIGERCGNTNLSTVIPNLQLKCSYPLVSAENLATITQTARYIAEICNIKLGGQMPYVGSSAFTHKAGMHADGVLKDPSTFEQIDPELVGNERRLPISEVTGRTALLERLRRFNPALDKSSDETMRVMARIKELEAGGYQFEAAQASLELLILKELGIFRPFFEIADYKIIASGIEGTDALAEAMVKVRVGQRHEITADEGNGPVNAMDRALRKALEVFYPILSRMHMIDYKVRVIGGSSAAITRVLIESSDGESTWTTVGASMDVISASIHALTDSLEYMLISGDEYNYCEND